MAMKVIFVGLATAVLAVGVPVGSVVAQTQQQLDWCESKDDPPPDLIISGCTAIIETGKLSGDILAIISNNRGNAYAMQREFDRAIAGPFLNRAHAKWGKGDRAEGDADIARFKQMCVCGTLRPSTSLTGRTGVGHYVDGSSEP